VARFRRRPRDAISPGVARTAIVRSQTFLLPKRPTGDESFNARRAVSGGSTLAGVSGHERLDAQPASDGSANVPRSEHSRVGTAMKAPDLVPLAAWIMWDMFVDETEPTDTRRKDDQREKPPEVKTPPRRQ
jgi:hypothetical protein